jgi:hypothetical protein
VPSAASCNTYPGGRELEVISSLEVIEGLVVVKLFDFLS